MLVKLTVRKQPEEGKSEGPFPQYATVEIKGDFVMVNDLLEKIKLNSEDYTFE